MREADLIHKAYERSIQAQQYIFCHYKKFNYDLLKYIWFRHTVGVGQRSSYNDVIIMADTETSKKHPDIFYPERKKQKYETFENHVVAWTISIRAYHHNICTLYGRHPSKMIETIQRIHDNMSGQKTVIYFHLYRNMPK